MQVKKTNGAFPTLPHMEKISASAKVKSNTHAHMKKETYETSVFLIITLSGRVQKLGWRCSEDRMPTFHYYTFS